MSEIIMSFYNLVSCPKVFRRYKYVTPHACNPNSKQWVTKIKRHKNKKNGIGKKDTVKEKRAERNKRAVVETLT